MQSINWLLSSQYPENCQHPKPDVILPIASRNISVKTIFILLSHLFQSLPLAVLSSGLTIYSRCALLFPTTPATCPAHLIVTNFITLMIIKLHANTHNCTGKENSVTAWTKTKVVIMCVQKSLVTHLIHWVLCIGTRCQCHMSITWCPYLKFQLSWCHRNKLVHKLAICFKFCEQTNVHVSGLSQAHKRRHKYWTLTLTQLTAKCQIF